MVGWHYRLNGRGFGWTPGVGDATALSSFCLQSFPASGSFPMIQFFTWGGQSLELQLQHQSFQCIFSGWSPLGWTGLTSLQSAGLSRVFSNTTVQKHPLFGTFFIVQLLHPYMTSGKTIALTRWTFVDKVMSLLFNMLSSLIIAFLPRSKSLNFMLKFHSYGG